MHKTQLFIFALITLVLSYSCYSKTPMQGTSPEHNELSLKLIYEGLRRPIFFTQLPGSDIHLVVEQRGTIRWFDKRDAQKNGTFMEVPDPLTSANEEGLLGLAFDPNIQNNGYFYLHYTQKIDQKTSCINELKRKRAACSVIARFQLNQDKTGAFVPTSGNPASKQVILMQRQPFSNHNGGMIAFGNDGMLYIGLGDGGSGGDPEGYAQNRKNLLGALLRLDVSKLPYTIPKNNPFYGNKSGIKEEIWAYGLRNPWRFSFDTETGALWVADVGQNAWEEVNIVEGGGNFGWNTYEGHSQYKNTKLEGSQHISPVITYGRSEGVSITGGYVYRGQKMPDWQGWYFYGDFGSGILWAAHAEDTSKSLIEPIQIMRTGLSISSFGTDSDGELYITDLSGKVYTIDHK